jgi:hypothetical protein
MLVRGWVRSEGVVLRVCGGESGEGGRDALLYVYAHEPAVSDGRSVGCCRYRVNAWEMGLSVVCLAWRWLNAEHVVALWVGL